MGDMNEGRMGVDSRRSRFNSLFGVFCVDVAMEVIGDVLRRLDGDSFMMAL